MSTVLLTGAGGAALPDLIRHLKGLGHRVLTADMNPHAPGLYLGDGGFVVPKATEPWYLDAIYTIMRAEAVDLTIPLIDEELPFCTYLEPFLIPSGEFVKTCLDKWDIMRKLRVAGIVIPHTWQVDHPATNHTMPLVFKPRRGRGSRGLAIGRTRDEIYEWYDKHFLRAKDFIAQEYIEGPEYTVSVVCDQNNMVHAVVPKAIILKEGQTKLAVTRRNDKIDALCRRIAEAMNPCGPFNVQLRLRDGEPYVFEINPRFSGTVNLTIAAGCDEVGGLIELAMGRPYTFGEWKEGVVLVRQTNDAVMSEEDFNQRAPRRWDA